MTQPISPVLSFSSALEFQEKDSHDGSTLMDMCEEHQLIYELNQKIQLCKNALQMVEMGDQSDNDAYQILLDEYRETYISVLDSVEGLFDITCQHSDVVSNKCDHLYDDIKITIPIITKLMQDITTKMSFNLQSQTNLDKVLLATGSDNNFDKTVHTEIGKWLESLNQVKTMTQSSVTSLMNIAKNSSASSGIVTGGLIDGENLFKHIKYVYEIEYALSIMTGTMGLVTASDLHSDRTVVVSDNDMKNLVDDSIQKLRAQKNKLSTYFNSYTSHVQITRHTIAILAYFVVITLDERIINNRESYAKRFQERFDHACELYKNSMRDTIQRIPNPINYVSTRMQTCDVEMNIITPVTQMMNAVIDEMKNSIMTETDDFFNCPNWSFEFFLHISEEVIKADLVNRDTAVNMKTKSLAKHENISPNLDYIRKDSDMAMYRIVDHMIQCDVISNVKKSKWTNVETMLKPS